MANKEFLTLSALASKDLPVQRLRTQCRRLQAKVDGIKAALRNPVSVHASMLRGDIARPSLRDFLHVGGEKEIADYDALRADAERYLALIEMSPSQEICFLGEGYFGKEALDAAIDAARKATP